jgi:hypothetical protein
VAAEAHLSREDAERAIHATLPTLGDELLDVKAQLPEDYVRALALAP